MSNLPSWNAADKVYAKAYRILDAMASAGHATPARGIRHFKNGSISYTTQGHVSESMTDLIAALNRGDEEEIKALLLRSDIFRYC